MAKEKNHSIIKYKMLFTIQTIFIYLIGRQIPLFGLDVSAYSEPEITAQSVFTQAINGDISKTSIFALGFSSYMVATILCQVFMVMWKSDKRAKMSPKKRNVITLIIVMLIAIFQAVSKVNELIYVQGGFSEFFMKVVACIQLIAGMLVLVWLSDRNQKYGVGGRSAIIFINILDGLILALSSAESLEELIVPVIIGVIVLVVVVVMESAEKRIPLQRISIHNIHADKNYLAIKLNPVGIMPIMFATSVFMLPQFIITTLQTFMPGSGVLKWLEVNMTLAKPLGIAVYIIILFGLTLMFAMIMINPREITDQFLKSGDSIPDIHAGKDTKKYLTRSVVTISIISAVVMSICAALPMILQSFGEISQSMAVVPSSVMMLTGIWCGLYQEYKALKKYDSYKPFI